MQSFLGNFFRHLAIFYGQTVVVAVGRRVDFDTCVQGLNISESIRDIFGQFQSFGQELPFNSSVGFAVVVVQCCEEFLLTPEIWIQIPSLYCIVQTKNINGLPFKSSACLKIS